MTFEIPIFPLNVVLFPGMQLPLHIFEQRYCTMISRCLDGESFGVELAFGVAMMVSGRGGDDNTYPANVGCLAHIAQVATLPDGRYNLMATGQRRFVIRSLREEDDYLVGTVEWLEDEGENEYADDEASRTRAALESYLQATAENSGAMSPDMMQLEIPISPYELSMWVAALLPLPPQEKQPLLETTSTIQRLLREYSLLKRSEVIQRAFFRRAAFLRQSNDPHAADQFASLN